MASTQKNREERAEAAAQKAADELAAVRRDHEPAVHEPSSPGRRGGIFGSVQESARSLLGAVRDTFSGSGGARDTTTAGHDSSAPGAMETSGDKLCEGRDYAAQKAEEGKEKAREMVDAAVGKAAETKDAAAEKARGAGEMVTDNARGAKDVAWETKDAAWDKAEGAREYVVDKKEAARQALAGSAEESKGETNESAWQQGQEVRRRAAEKAEEDRLRAHEPSEEEKGRSATENIFGSAKGLTEAFKEKMTMPTDVVEQKLAEARGGGRKGEPTPSPRGEAEADDEEDVLLRVKAADHMTGQAFNDVGKMGEEGTGITPASRARATGKDA